MHKKNTIKENKIKRAFIENTNKIIKEEGLSKVKIRKVASKAGFNSATIYNYFENLDHLILLALMKYLKDYTSSIPEYLSNAKNSMDRFLKDWECFCYYSFKNPEIYYSIFFADIGRNFNEYIKEYYKLYPEELGNQNEDISSMLLKYNIYERNMVLVNECVKEGFIKAEDAESLNEISILLYEGMLFKVVNKKIDPGKAMNKTIKYIRHTANSFSLKQLT